MITIQPDLIFRFLIQNSKLKTICLVRGWGKEEQRSIDLAILRLDSSGGELLLADSHPPLPPPKGGNSGRRKKEEGSPSTPLREQRRKNAYCFYDNG